MTKVEFNKRKVIILTCAVIFLTICGFHNNCGVAVIILSVPAFTLSFFTFKTPKFAVPWIFIVSFVMLWLVQTEMFAENFKLMTFPLIILNYLVCFTVITLCVLITPAFGVSIGCILLFVFVTINRYTVLFRGTELRPEDFAAWRTAMNVSSGYSLWPDFTMVILGVFLLWILVLDSSLKYEISRKKAAILFGAGVLATIIIFPIATKNKSSYEWRAAGSEYNGVLGNFVMQINENRVVKPRGYDVAKLEKLPCEEKEADSYPNIIVVVNESFADLSQIGKMDEDVMPYIRSLDNTVSGYTYSSVYGGMTPKTEYEFLTGNSLGLLPKGINPFMKTVDDTTYSMVSELKGRGYYCVGMHPFLADGWNRNTVYPTLGFDECLFLDSFPEGEIRGLVSDKVAYEKVIEEYEKEDSPKFIYLMTIQNHGNYDVEDYENTVKTTSPEASQYLSLIKESDEDMKTLIEYFKNEDEPTIILFFGDHFPALPAEYYNELHGSELNENDINDYELLHKVPFFIWANYDIEDQDNVETSMNYLSTYLYDTAGFMPKYNSVLKNIQKDVPVINSIGYYSNSEHTFKDIREAEDKEKEAIDLYRKLEYNNTYDDNRIDMFSKK